MIYLSICIPTYKKIDITRSALKSIFDNTADVDLRDFEVVISDNDPEMSSMCFKDEFEKPNLHYYNTNCEGFLNSYYVLSYGKGEFLKLHNNGMCYTANSLKLQIDFIKQHLEKKPHIFFSNGLCEDLKVSEYNKFDDFVNALGYKSSWSAGFGIWKEDYDKIKNGISINKWFPQTSFLLGCYDKDRYILNDRPLLVGHVDHSKGGYNPLRVFGIEYLSMLHKSLEDKHISETTFNGIKYSLLKDYLAARFFKSVILRKESYRFDHPFRYLFKYYKWYDFFRLLFYSIRLPFLYVLGIKKRSIILNN